MSIQSVVNLLNNIMDIVILRAEIKSIIQASVATREANDILCKYIRMKNLQLGKSVHYII